MHIELEGGLISMSHGSSCFNWDQYIFLAEMVLNSPEVIPIKESAQRSAISRAYYGAFCLTRNLAFQQNWVTKSRSSNIHSKVIKYFKNSSDKLKIEIGINLDRLRKDRNNADYSDSWSKINQNYSIKCIEVAKNIKNNIIKLESQINDKDR